MKMLLNTLLTLFSLGSDQCSTKSNTWQGSRTSCESICFSSTYNWDFYDYWHRTVSCQDQCHVSYSVWYAY